LLALTLPFSIPFPLRSHLLPFSRSLLPPPLLSPPFPTVPLPPCVLLSPFYALLFFFGLPLRCSLLLLSLPSLALLPPSPSAAFSVSLTANAVAARR
jgi:hypothetical protein